jgi:ribonuclease HI
LKRALVLRTDGAARGNPGPAGAGVVLEDAKGRALRERSCFLGSRTNNQAEYEALLLGLRELLKGALGAGRTHVTAFLDSELVVRQLEGAYRVRDPELLVLHEEVRALIARLGSFRARHVPREENRRADRLANEAIDRAVSGAEDATSAPVREADAIDRAVSGAEDATSAPPRTIDSELSRGRTAAPGASAPGEESPGSAGQGAPRQGEAFPSVSGERRPVPQKTHRRTRLRALPGLADGERRPGGRGFPDAGGKGEKVR